MPEDTAVQELTLDEQARLKAMEFLREAGRKGGLSRSKAKRDAGRKNIKIATKIRLQQQRDKPRKRKTG